MDVIDRLMKVLPLLFVLALIGGIVYIYAIIRFIIYLIKFIIMIQL